MYETDVVPVQILLAVCGVLLATSVLAILMPRRISATRPVYTLCLLATGLACVVAVHALLRAGSGVDRAFLPLGLPWLGAHFRLDALSAFFALVVNLGAALASLYALGYGRHESEPHRVLPFFPAFLAVMNMVVLADDAFTFVFCWELMSLVSWALVIAHHEVPDNIRAGYIYLLMAGFGTVCLLLGFGLLAGASGGYAFDMMRASQLTAADGAMVLVLVLIGTGSKAGLVPMHVWLPLAHPAAPSHVSALLSGVMTKVAIYGFVRIVFDLLGVPQWWWGVVILIPAGVTTLLGILYALMEHDLKKLLAYSTVENIGIIFIGLGLALSFRSNQMLVAAALALTAALFHVFNHSLFKSLLFFGAGAVLVSTGKRDIESLGGLIHRMPWTAVAFLAGCVSISALPPFNGFVSEWLTFQAVLLSPQLPQWILKFLVPVVGATLACSAALAAACFVKAFGLTFLGRPRTTVAKEARETDRASIAAMLCLAVLCLAAGVLPGFVMDALAPVTGLLVHAHLPEQWPNPWLQIVPISTARSSYNGFLVFTMIAIAAALTAAVIHRRASRGLRRVPAWDCGFPEPSPVTQYTSSSFGQPFRRIFGTVFFGARETVVMPPPGDIGPARLQVTLRDTIWEVIYVPIGAFVNFAADRLNTLQFLTIRRYLTLVFGALIVLLVVLTVWQ